VHSPVYVLLKGTPTKEQQVTYQTAIRILEEHDLQLQQESELLAELGSGAFVSGYDAGDAMLVARMQLDEMRDPELDAAYDAQVAEAKAVVAAFPVKVTYHHPILMTWRAAAASLESDIGADVPGDDDLANIPF
jgi:hypothetical protein